LLSAPLVRQPGDLGVEGNAADGRGELVHAVDGERIGRWNYTHKLKPVKILKQASI